MLFLICHFPSQTERGQDPIPSAAGGATGQAIAEYVIAMFLCALVAVGVFKMYQTASRIHYNDIAKARTGVMGMRP